LIIISIDWALRETILIFEKFSNLEEKEDEEEKIKIYEKYFAFYF